MILVTGATGNVGRPLVGLLAGAGVPFKAFVRDPERAHDLLCSGVELVRGDFAEPATLEGVEVMFLLVGFYAAVHEGNHDLVTDTVAEVTGRQPYTFDSFVREHDAAFGGSPAR